MSRYFTKAADRKRERPNANMYSSNKLNGNRTAVACNGTMFMAMNTPTTTKFRPKLISDDRLLDITIIHLGIFIFLIKSPLPTIDVKLWLVISSKKFQRTIPSNR